MEACSGMSNAVGHPSLIHRCETCLQCLGGKLKLFWLQAGKDQKSTADSGDSSSSSEASGAAATPKIPRVLMGHSLGASCAAAEAIKNPEVSCTLHSYF